MIQYGSWWAFAVLLPIVYWRLPIKLRPALLAAASFAILVLLAPLALVMMTGLSLFVYAVHTIPLPSPDHQGPAVRLRRITRSTVPIVLVSVYLLWFKYWQPLGGQFDHRPDAAAIAIPLGISYFSFKLLHYAIERGRGMLPAHNLPDFLSWLFLMPIFTSGPIERFDHFLEHRDGQFRFDHIVIGGTRIAQGLVKKFAILPSVAGLSYTIAGSDWVAFTHGTAGMQGAGPVWAYLALELILSYLDFSAYSDIAIGCSRLFGLTIMENFNYPLLATNLVEFWRRYHMSLTNWCRAYIYMPMLGYTRNPYMALIATFIVVGLWHAGSLNWLLWGLWHGVGQAVAVRWGRFAQRKRIMFFKSSAGRMLGWAMTIAYVMLGCALEAVHGQGTACDALRLMGRAFGG